MFTEVINAINERAAGDTPSPDDYFSEGLRYCGKTLENCEVLRKKCSAGCPTVISSKSTSLTYRTTCSDSVGSAVGLRSE